MMARPDAEVFRFAGLTLDMAKGRLTSATGEVALRRKAFDLLCYLVRHSGHVLSKDDLLAAVWPDVTVSDESLTQCVHDLRRVLGPDGAGLLHTVPRRGYMFEAVEPEAAPLPASEARPLTPQVPDPDPATRARSIAIMPACARQSQARTNAGCSA